MRRAVRDEGCAAPGPVTSRGQQWIITAVNQYLGLGLGRQLVVAQQGWLMVRHARPVPSARPADGEPHVLGPLGPVVVRADRDR